MSLAASMRRSRRLLGSLAALLLVLGPAAWQSACTADTKALQPPLAERIPRELTIHGQTRVDDYYWLNERANPKVIEYLEAENAYAKAAMARTEALQDKLYAEMVGRMKPADRSVPVLDNGYHYYSRYEEGKDYPIHCRKKESLDAPEEILIDANVLSQGYGYFDIADLSASDDNRLLAYGVDTVSRRQYTIRFKDLGTGAELPDTILMTTGSAAWSADASTVFYTRIDETTLRPFRVMRHVLGTPVESDREVFRETDETFTVEAYRSRSRKYIMIAAQHTLSSEYRFLDAAAPDGEFRILQPRERGLEYQADHLGDKFYILTNLNARNFRLMAAPESELAKESWKEVIPHREDVFLEGFTAFTDYLVLAERKNGLTGIRVMRWDKTGDHKVDFGEETYAASIGANPGVDGSLLRFNYESLTTPPSTFEYDMKARTRTLLKQEEVLGGFSAESYRAERLYATARDGVKVPISLVYRQGLEKTGAAPLLLYGYGSYGASTDPGFNAARLSLLDRGFIYAIAHIRGGQEMGRAWYEDGKLLKKKNTFTDFIDCAEHLVAQKYASPDRLFAQGGSAGGLLMGAVVNMRPDLFKGIIAAVPFVDVITTMLDTSIPLTTGEFDEWGNPAEKEYYDYMLSYSPYDQIEVKNYPALLVTTGLHDSQVQYFEPAKWVAKLRALKTDRNPLIFHVNMEGGHGGVSGRFRRLKETALQYAFLIDLAGIRE